MCINISYKVQAAKAAEVEEPLIAHGKHMDHVYPSGNPDGVNPAEAYFTKSEEFNDPTDPSKGKTGNIIFTLNEKWHKPEHIQNHIGKERQHHTFQNLLKPCSMQMLALWVKYSTS